MLLENLEIFSPGTHLLDREQFEQCDRKKYKTQSFGIQGFARRGQLT